ncbi:MAG: hypothetical protein KIT84_20455 [Labilithrix sp.]|nr:hypothetical protein [Labilithrix sp.]MCW5813412.1 hypothetical protein [Labilithrix sp.]
MKRRPRSKFRLVLNALAFLAGLAGILWILGTKNAEPEAEAAPPKKPAGAAPADAGAEAAAAAPAPAADHVKEKKEDDGKDEKKDPEPIDLAIAPDGGVPFHPNAGRYRSPFAKPGNEPALKVKVGFLLNTVDNYDVKTGTFTADFFLSLTSPAPMPPTELQFPNGTIDKKEVIADRPTFKLFRMGGSFKSPPDLRKYPFDNQDLKIIMEDDSAGIDQVEFVADSERTQLARGFRALGWQVSYIDAKTTTTAYPDRFENDDLLYSRYTFALGVERYATSAAFKVFVPAFVIVLISLLGMWVPADEMEVRSNSGAPMLAGAVLFHFSLMQELPSTMYLTRADKLMLAVYISLLLGMISTWWMFLVKEHNIPVVFRVARIAVPVLSVITMALGCFA